MHGRVFIEPQYDTDDNRQSSVPEEYITSCHLDHLLPNLHGSSYIGPLMIDHAPEELVVECVELEGSQLDVIDLYLLEEGLTEDADGDALDLTEEGREVLEHLLSNLYV